MSGINPISDIVSTVGSVIGDLHTSDKERAELENQRLEIEQRPQLAQIDVNKVEAAHPSRFVAGGRPAIIWIGAASLGWTFIAHPMLMWLWALGQATGHLPKEFPPPPTLDNSDLWVIVSGVLGIGGLRSFDKKNGTETKRTQ